MAFKRYTVLGVSTPLELSAEHADQLGATEVDDTASPPPKSATKATWVDHAVSQGMDVDTATAFSRTELIEQFGV